MQRSASVRLLQRTNEIVRHIRAASTTAATLYHELLPDNNQPAMEAAPMEDFVATKGTITSTVTSSGEIADGDEMVIRVTTEVTQTYEPNPDYVAKAVKRYHAPPDAYYRMDAADEKRHLDYNGKYYEGNGGSTGVVARWNMSTTEENFSVYINKTCKGGKHTSVKVNFVNEEAAKKFYTKFKLIITTNLIHAGFRGGAFAELVKPNAPIYDILWVVHSSPLLSRDMKAFWSKVPIAIHNKIRSYAVSGSDRYFIDEQWFDIHFSEQMDHLRNFFHNEHYYPTPLPNDVSNAWLKEFGAKFTNNYALALKGNGPFKVEKPFHVKKEWKFFNYKAEWKVKKTIPGSNAPNPSAKVATPTKGERANNSTSLEGQSTTNNVDNAMVTTPKAVKKGENIGSTIKAVEDSPSSIYSKGSGFNSPSGLSPKMKAVAGNADSTNMTKSATMTSVYEAAASPKNAAINTAVNRNKGLGEQYKDRFSKQGLDENDAIELESMLSGAKISDSEALKKDSSAKN